MNEWERCAWALVVLGCVGGSRIGMAQAVQLRDVRLGQHADVIAVIYRARLKTEQHRSSGQRGAKPQAVVLRHWLVGTCIRPWVLWLRARSLGPGTLLFPSLVRQKHTRVRTAVGTAVGDLWLEPTKMWSARSVATALQLVLGDELRGRHYHGLRGGQNRELRRSPTVADTTRRALHCRTLRDLIGSESSYEEVFAENFCDATASLGSKRIVRVAGVPRVVATSASSARLDDWVPCNADIDLTDSDMERETDGSSPSSDAVPSDAASYVCWRCSDRVSRHEHGFRCDVPRCREGVCVACHRGGPGTPLKCAEHTQ